MADTAPTAPAAPLRVGSLFSGYGGLDLAVEEVFGAKTIWFSEINEPVARVFSHHWPEAPNLGDITTIDWNTVPPVDILCGGFPCQDVSTVGKMAGLKPGTRSGLWARMAAAIDVLQPEWVVIENVRGLLSAPAIRAHVEAVASGRNRYSTSSGSRSSSGRPGRPPVRRAMDRFTRFRHRRTPPQIPRLHPRPPHSSEPHSPQTPHAAGRACNR